MEDEDHAALFAGVHSPSKRDGGAAGLLAGENLDSYSQDELVQRVALLEAEILRVKAHHGRAAAHRLAAEALFRPRNG